jgi:hypothetical protein
MRELRQRHKLHVKASSSAADERIVRSWAAASTQPDLVVARAGSTALSRAPDKAKRIGESAQRARLTLIQAVHGSLSAREIAVVLGGDGRADASGSYAARCSCPAHKDGDRNSSLSLNDGRDRGVLYCFAGGAFQEIAAALRARGLMPPFRSWRRS